MLFLHHRIMICCFPFTNLQRQSLSDVIQCFDMHSSLMAIQNQTRRKNRSKFANAMRNANVPVSGDVFYL